jgi:hypothetical protein
MALCGQYALYINASQQTHFVSEGVFEKQREMGGWRPSEKLEMAGYTLFTRAGILASWDY